MEKENKLGAKEKTEMHNEKIKEKSEVERKIQMRKEKKPESKDNKEHTAKVSGRNLPISSKHSKEVCSFILNKDLNKAKQLLSRVIKREIAIPYKRHNRKLAHKPGKVGPGRYPLKPIEHITKLLNAVEANAEDKGIDTKNLIICEAKANKATQQLHYGRKRRRLMKRTHIDIVVKEK